MSSTSVKGQILEAIGARLSTISQANGYSTDVKKVYSDMIPMGIQLRKDQLPAIFVLDGPDNIENEFECVKGNWDVRLQLWHESKLSDTIMLEFAMNVFKAIYANSPTAQRNDEFKTIHEKVWRIIPLSISPDLNMIEANRIIEVTFLVQYRTKFYEM